MILPDHIESLLSKGWYRCGQGFAHPVHGYINTPESAASFRKLAKPADPEQDQLYENAMKAFDTVPMPTVADWIAEGSKGFGAEG
jgi:hypothetical protein